MARDFPPEILEKSNAITFVRFQKSSPNTKHVHVSAFGMVSATTIQYY